MPSPASPASPVQLNDGKESTPASLQDHIAKDGVEAANLLRWRVPNTTPTKRTRSRSDTFPRSPTKIDPESPSLTGSPKAGNSPKGSASKKKVQRSPARRETNSDDEGEDITESDLFRHKLYLYLFRNLNRALDELYYMCETESCPEHFEEGSEGARIVTQRFRQAHRAHLPPGSISNGSGHIVPAATSKGSSMGSADPTTRRRWSKSDHHCCP